MNIYVVRHGQTDWNIEDKLQGHSNIPLNNVGINQAYIVKDLLKKVNFSTIYSSPLKRCIDTAKIINQNYNLSILNDERLLERGFGDLEGTIGNSINDYWIYERNLSTFNVESIHNFFSRINNFLQEIIKNSSENENILIVTHNGVNIAINCFFNPHLITTDFKKLNLKNCDYKKYVINKEDFYEK